MQSRLAVGMTPQEAAALFGPPNVATDEGQRASRVFTYLSPVGRRTRDVEGYVGFKAFFTDDRLTGWQSIRSKPSYDHDMHTRQHLVPVAVWWGLLFVGSFIYVLGKAFRRGRSEYERILEAYARRTIRSWRLPPEFRFINHETTLAEVMQRLRTSSRVLTLPVNEETVAGYGTIEDEAGAPAILIHEYQLPYRAAVIVMPEFPFEPENRIRAVFYRAPLRDEE